MATLGMVYDFISKWRAFLRFFTGCNTEIYGFAQDSGYIFLGDIANATVEPLAQ